MSNPTSDHPWVDEQKARARKPNPRLFPPLPKRKGQYDAPGPSLIESIKKFTDAVRHVFKVKDDASWRGAAEDYRELRRSTLVPSETPKLVVTGVAGGRILAPDRIETEVINGRPRRVRAMLTLTGDEARAVLSACHMKGEAQVFIDGAPCVVTNVHVVSVSGGDVYEIDVEGLYA